MSFVEWLNEFKYIVQSTEVQYNLQISREKCIKRALCLITEDVVLLFTSFALSLVVILCSSIAYVMFGKLKVCKYIQLYCSPLGLHTNTVNTHSKCCFC